jgi:hypothetical protein
MCRSSSACARWAKNIDNFDFADTTDQRGTDPRSRQRHLHRRPTQRHSCFNSGLQIVDICDWPKRPKIGVLDAAISKAVATFTCIGFVYNRWGRPSVRLHGCCPYPLAGFLRPMPASEIRSSPQEFRICPIRLFSEFWLTASNRA